MGNPESVYLDFCGALGALACVQPEITGSPGFVCQGTCGVLREQSGFHDPVP